MRRVFGFLGTGSALDDANDEKRRGIVALRKILKKISKNRGRLEEYLARFHEKRYLFITFEKL